MNLHIYYIIENLKIMILIIIIYLIIHFYIIYLDQSSKFKSLNKFFKLLIYLINPLFFFWRSSFLAI